jgi:transposase
MPCVIGLCLGPLARLLLLWDGAPIHRSHLVTAFLANGAAERLQIERLPAYAPELNPVEGLWAHLKGSSCAMCVASIPASTERTTRRGEAGPSKPPIIKGCFEGAKL